MKTIGEYRARYPQLRELTDYQLTRAVYDTTAPDMPLEDFAKAFGGVPEEDPEEVRIQEYNLSHPDDTIRREDMEKASLLSDTGHGIAAGINELAAIPFWLAEEAGIESAGKAKDYFLKSAEEKRKGYSPEMKLARAEEFFTEEPDGSYGFGGAWTSPRKILGSVAESAPGMVGGMGLSALAARGLMKAGFSRGLAWAVGSSLGEGTIGGAQNALDVHEAILAMPEDKLAASPEYQEILQRTGDPKRAREELANSVAAMTGLKTGASTAVLSAPSGYMFGKILGGETGKTLLGTAAKQGAAEFGEEAGQSGAEQYLSQAELQRADPTIDPMSGVGEAAVSGGFAGMAMGGGMGGFGHVLGGRAQQQPGAPAVSDAQPVLPPEQQAALPEGGHGSPLELGPGQNIVMGTDRAYEDPIATPPPTSPLQKGMEAILGGPLGLSTAPAAPDFAVTPGGRAVSANGIVQPDAFGPVAAGMRSDMPPLLADQVYDVEYSVVPGAPKALSEAPRGLPLGQDKSPVAPESPQPVAVQTDGESTPLQLTRINDKSFMLHGDTGPFEEAIKAAGGRLDRKVGGWRFPLAREGEIRELFGIPLGAETVPGDNLVSEVPEASPEVLRETPLPVSGDMAMSGQTGLEVTHGGLQQGTPGAGTGELLSESVPVDAAGNPGELAAAARGSGRYHGDLGNRPDLDTALPGVDGREAGLGAAVQRTAGSVEVPGEGRGQNVSFNQIPTIPDSGRSASGRGDEPAFRGLPEVGRDVSGGSKGTKNASFEKNGRKGIERKLLRAIERQQGGVSPEAEAWAHGLNPQERKKAYEQLVLNEFKRHTASELGVDEESLRFIPVRKDSETSLRLKEIGGVFGQDVVIFKDSSSVQTGIRGASVPTIEHVVFMEGSAEREKPYLFVLGHELLHRMRSEDLKAYKQFQEYLLDDLQEGAIPRYRENLDRRTGGDGTVARMSDEAILEEIGADLVGKRLTEESFWAKMADERPSLFARVAQLVRDLLDRVTAAFRADPLPAAWVKDFDAIRRHIDAMMGQWAEKNARAKTGGTPPHSGNTREVLDGRDETVRNAGRNGGEGSDHAGGLLQSNRGRHGAPVDLVGDGGRGGDGGRAAQPAPEGREGERPRQPVAVKIPNRADEPAHYELLEADDVRASHLPSRGFQKNPAYGLENERRYHDEPGSRAKVMENAAKLDPAFLMESVDANHGAPVIDHDNNVLGGNGRAMSIARAYESFPERGEQYREALKANADRLGIDPAQVDAMHSPMLVRRLERGMSREERQRLVTVMNDDFKDAKEKRASGKSRGERFGRRTLDMLSAGLKDAESLREYFDTPASVAVVERMMEDGVIQRSERNALVGADGLLNPDGKKVVEEALRGRIARSYEALAKLPADVVGKLDAVIPHILVAEGIGKPWNITEHVRDSVDLLVGFKGSGVKEPDTYLKQVNMLTGRAPVQDFSKQAIALFRMALDAKKGEYVKAFESYLKNAKLSPEAGNIPGVAKPQDKAFRDAFGMKTEATPNKPEKREAEKPQTEEETKGQPPEKSPKKEPQEQTSGKPGDAGHVERHRALYKSLLNGKASLEDYHRGFSALLENEEAVRAELSGMTVNALLARGGAMFAWRHKGDKKADIVDALYRDMLSDFTLGQPYSVSGFMGMGPEEYRKATVASIRRIVDAQSEQTLADFARDAAAQREEYASRRKAEREAVENPKTLEDFRSFIRFHMDEGKTASEARDLLSFEQREQFDRLAAEASRSTRKTKAEPVLSSSSQTTGGEIIATKHTQKGHDLFVVRLEDRVSREDYLALLSSAKKLGGYYSKFRGNGAVPGFQFTGREQAEAFLKLAQGDKAEAQEAVKARRDAYEDDRSQTAVQRLNEMADRLDEDADASLNAARKVNTAKRAGQAAAAAAMAYADKSLAKTMRNIAGAIGNGTATFLDRVREKKQVEQLRDALRMAKWEEDKTKYPAWDQREKHSEEPATTQTVEFAAFPHYRLYRSSWAELGRKLSEKDGTKSLGKKILSVADDVTETYLEFARSHLEEVSTYATQAGKPAVFKSREDAEKAIARSGYRGKAVVLPVKRGENRIILSPSAAQERGIWKGDDDRMLSLRPELVDELFDKQGSTSRDIPWQLFDIRQKRKALARMGIETPAEYRMALREFVGLQAAAKQDKLRELERSVMRDAANNRGWLDFFPTPVAVTEEMLAAADIRPGMGVLEPSAGMGHIADRIREKGVEPVVAELEPQKRELLEAKGYEVIGKDFMKDIPEGESFDRIVMNPPFSKRQDTEHVRRAYDLLNPGGKLVAIVSEGSFFGKDKKASEFRDWLEEVGGTSEKLAEGSFNDPSLPVTTGVNTRMVVIEKEGTPMASVTPGEFLPAMPSTRLRIRKAAVQRVADALGKRAANAADTRGVQSFEELPEHIRQLYGDVASRLEGVYDPASGTVYLVADNLHSTARAAEVWMHENMVHHGLNGLLGMDEKRRVLNRLWQGMGGMGNAEIASVANKYGVDPLWDVKDRALVMEEYLARLAEKRAAGKLSDQEQTLWRRFVEAVLRAWHALVDAVTGRTGSMKYENVDRLLSALDRYVFEGRPEGMAEGGMVPAMASVDRSGSDMEAAHAAWEQLQRDMAEWGRQVDAFEPSEGRGRQPRLMTVCHTPDVLQKMGAPDLPMTMTADNLGKVLSDKVDHGLPMDLVKQLPSALVEPIMVFESASQANSFVVLTELKHEGRSVMAAVHLDTEKQNIRVNDIASAYKRSNEMWYVRQMEEGRLLYQDKKKSLAWARTNRLQLPRVRKLPSRLSEKRILTEEDVVKPIAPDNKPLASLRDVFGTTAKEEQRAEDAAPKTPLDSFRSKIGGHRPTVAERFAAFRENWKRKVEQQVFDHFASIKDVSKDGYVQARMTTSLGTQIESLIKYGAPVWNDGIMGVEGKSLTDVFAPVASEMDSFMGWMVANRAARLKKEGRENLFTDAEIAAAQKLNEGVMPDGSKRAATYKQVFEDFARFKKAVLDFAQEGGIIDPESRSAWENADYIPFYRVKDGLDAVRSARNNSGLAGQSSGIKTLKGGKANIGDPVENIMRNFIHLIDAAQKNRAADMILQDMAKARLAHKLTPEEVARLEKRQGDELTEVLAQDKELAAQCGPLTDSQKKVIAATFNPTEFNYVRVQKDGKSLYYSVEDPMLLDALTGMWKQDGRQGPVWKLLRGTRRLLTTGVTSMPDFMLRNFLRDTLHAWTIEHQSGYRPLVDSLAQIKNTFNVDEDTKQLLAAGSAFMGSGYRLGNSGEEAAKALNKVLDKYGMDKKAFQDSVLDTGEKLKAFVGKLREGYEHAGSAAENAARLAVYKKMRAKGFSHREAAFAAKDLMDFTVRGQSQLIQSLCETVPFLGARLAGLHRLGRGAVENPRAFAAKGMTIALASMALYALNQALNPDDWDKMEDWEKDTYFHFWVDGEHFRLPKPFEVGFIFGTIPERMMEQLITDKSGGVFASRVFAGIWDQLAFNPFPQAVRPLVEQIANKDFFRGTPIVGMGMDRKAPVDQFDSRTSLTVRAMASFMDALLTPVMGKTGADVLRSPKRLEHLVNGYFGGLGAFVLGASDMVLRPLGNEPEAPERKLEELPIIRSFYGGSGEKRTRYESELYEVMKQGNKLHASLKQIAEEGGNVSAAKAELSHDDIVALANRKGLTALTKEFGKLNKAAEKVRINRVMSSSDKQRELDNIQRRKNILAQRAMKRIEEMRVQ